MPECAYVSHVGGLAHKKIANTIDVGTGHMEHSLVCLKKLSES